MQNPPQSYFSFPRHKGHNPWLDALRALAIIFVLLRHGVRVQPGGYSPDNVFHNIFANGWIGVDLFFVLSGYLIAKSLLKRMRGGGLGFSWRYFEDRILRIVPAYYAVLLLCVIGFFPGFFVAPEGLDARLAYHLVFLQDYMGSNINVVFWSLGVEEKFYILVPFLMLALLKVKSLWGQLAICAALLLISPLSRALTYGALESGVDYQVFFNSLRSPFHMSLEGFIAGIIVALLQVGGLLFKAKTAKLVLAGSFASLLIWTGSHEFLNTITFFDASAQPLLLSLIFGLMVLCGVSLADQAMPAEPVFRVKAHLSYTLYLVHFPMIPLALGLTQNLMMFWLVYIVLSCLAAAALHFAIEKPFLKLKAKRSAGTRIPQTKAII